jgi:hypothetical protein
MRCLLLSALLLLAAPLSAQHRVERFLVAPEPPPIVVDVVVADSTVRRSTLRLATGGLLGGAIGGAGLGVAGYLVGCGGPDPGGGGIEDDGFCGILALPGFLIGEVVGMSLGVHWANDSNGSLPATALAAFGGLLVGSGLLILAFDAAQLVTPFVVAGQLAATIMTERATEDIDEYYDPED